MKFIPNEITRKVGRLLLKSKKNSPHIYFAAGVVGIVGSTVLACRATLKLDKTVDEFRDEVLTVKELASSQVNIKNYREGDYVKDLAFVYSKGAYRLGKLYGVPAVLGGVSIVLITGSHVQLTRRNAALTATLTALAKTFDDYRLRVREEIGEERELEIHRAIRTEKVEGSKALVKVTDPAGWSDYMREFNESNIHYEKTAEFNRIFLECQQRYLNHKLQARGHVFLNEVYEAIGFEPTKAGQLVGWVWKNKDGDNYIDFGLYEAHAHEFVMGVEPALCIDFNVDGVILDLIEEFN